MKQDHNKGKEGTTVLSPPPHLSDKEEMAPPPQETEVALALPHQPAPPDDPTLRQQKDAIMRFEAETRFYEAKKEAYEAESLFYKAKSEASKAEALKHSAETIKIIGKNLGSYEETRNLAKHNRNLAEQTRLKAEKTPTEDAKTRNCEAKKCVVCWERPVNTVLVPCGHACMCGVCSSKILTNCPECREGIREAVKIWAKVVEETEEEKTRTAEEKTRNLAEQNRAKERMLQEKILAYLMKSSPKDDKDGTPPKEDEVETKEAAAAATASNATGADEAVGQLGREFETSTI